MKFLMHKFVPMLFALASVLFLVHTLKQLIKDEPVNIVFPAVAVANLTLAVVVFAVGIAARRKAAAASDSPTA